MDDNNIQIKSKNNFIRIRTEFLFISRIHLSDEADIDIDDSVSITSSTSSSSSLALSRAVCRGCLQKCSQMQNIFDNKPSIFELLRDLTSTLHVILHSSHFHSARRREIQLNWDFFIGAFRWWFAAANVSWLCSMFDSSRCIQEAIGISRCSPSPQSEYKVRNYMLRLLQLKELNLF